MGKVSPVVITDEEKGMFYALQNLKKEGIFKGKHLFDMFHILRKFRKCSSSSETFQNMRAMMHAKDRQQYRRLFKKAKEEIVNDKEL